MFVPRDHTSSGTTDMTDPPIYVPIPRDLYNEMVVRFGGTVDPVEFITRQARQLVRCKAVPFSPPENLSPGWRLSTLEELERSARHNWEEFFC